MGGDLQKMGRLDTMYLQTHHFSPWLLLSGLLVLTMDVTSGQISIQLIPQYPAINGSVTLSVTGITEKLELVSWYKGPGKSTQYQILAYVPGNNLPTLVPGLLYNDRISAFNNGSLHIKDLRVTDGGNYIVAVQTVTPAKDISVTLTIYEPVVKPRITAPTTQPKENESFTLTCNTVHATTIRWTRIGASVPSGAKLSGDNKTLTFSSVKRGDAGEYRCEARNLVSASTSDPYTVTVPYGPDKVQIEGAAFVRPGSSITLTCSADSVPPPEYQWKRNGTDIKEKTNKYTISNAAPEDEGLYTCVVRNNVTLRTATDSVYVNVTAEYTEPVSEDLPMIIGVVVAGVLLLILIIALIYLFMIHKRRKSSSDTTNSMMKSSSRNGQAEIPTQSPEQHELQYAAIEFKNQPKKEKTPELIYENRSPEALPPSTDNVVYSELKLR
ncbi:cell adhesion molecule CEACAM8-like isoform X2 [Dendrobates tinctorius]|uniref:cell adhesion molecule CEACAM8-like isoform X2 n=1 Tax=Dendrobates tinctorius TaxID=92724 RepID=UPI003CC93ADD